ncbi:MAG: Na-K-Cl cotransporter, partial [Chloroflexi bacterium]
PINDMGREQVINVWMSEQGPDWRLDLRESNMDLAILTAYQLARNWRGRVNLCMAVQDAETAEKAQQFLQELISLARLTRQTEAVVLERPFFDALTSAPQADLNIFGLPHQPDLKFVQQIVQQVDTSCIFVRDSGEESALA